MTYEKLLRYEKPYAPIQITHDFEFVALNLGNGYTEIRDLDGAGRIAYIKERIDKLFSRGYGGVAINVDFKDYLRDDEALEIFYEAAKYAKSLGMRVWVYESNIILRAVREAFLSLIIRTARRSDLQRS